MAIRNCFAAEEVNTGRQIEFDLLKSITIILMIWIHVHEFIADQSSFIGWVNDEVIGGVSAAVTFMFCMGVGMIYSKNQSPSGFIHRGFKLLTMGFVLNIARYGVPHLLAAFTGHGEECVHYLPLMIGVDIMQFAGLAFILTGLLRKRLKPLHILGIAVLMSGAGTLLEGVQTDIYPIDQIIGYFWGTYSESYFPLFNWYLPVATGLCFGTAYKHLRDKKKFHSIVLPIGIVIAAIYYYLICFTDQHFFTMLNGLRWFTHRSIQDMVICCLLNISLVSLFYFIGKIVKESWMPVLSYPAKHINQYYCTSWVIIILSSTLIFNGDSRLDTTLEELLGTAAIFAITTGILIGYNNSWKVHTDAFFGKHPVFWTILVWTIAIVVATTGFILTDDYANLMNNYLLGNPVLSIK